MIMSRQVVDPIVLPGAGSEATPDFTARVGVFAEEIRRSLTVSVTGNTRRSDAGAGTVVRSEGELIRRTGLDRSLVGRVLRSLQLNSDAAFLAELPSPEGLRLFVGAAAAAGLLAEPAAQAAMAVTADYERFINDYPGKRRAFRLRLVASDPGQRSRADQAARRTMYKAASELLGYSARDVTATLFVIDGEDPVRYDSAHLFGKFGLQRARPDCPPIRVGAVQAGRSELERGYLPLDATANDRTPASCVLLPFCRGGTRVEFVGDPSRFVEIQLPANSPPVHQRVDIVCGQRAPGMMLRRAKPDFSHEWYGAVTRIPCERLTVDVVLGPGAYEGWMPRLSARLHRNDPPVPPRPGVRGTDELRVDAAVHDLGYGFGQADMARVPRYSECLRNGARLLSLAEEGVRVVRIIKEFPELNAGLFCWFPLESEAQTGDGKA